MNKRRRNKIEKTSSPKKKTPLLRWLLFISVLLLALYLLYFVFTVISQRTTDVTKLNSSSDYVLSKQNQDLERTLIVFEEGKGEARKITDVYLYMGNKQKKQALLIYLSGDTYFTGLEEEFGNKVAVSSFRYAGDFLAKGRGVEYAIWQLNQLFSVKSHNYIWFSSEYMDVVNTVFGDSREKSGTVEKMESFYNKFSKLKILFSVYKLSSIDGEIYSNMEFFNVINKIEEISTNKNKYQVSKIILSDEKYLMKEKSAIGEDIKVLNLKEYDRAVRSLSSKLLDGELERERGRIEVYNASNMSGAAGSLGRKISNTGGDVVRYGNAPIISEKTILYVPNMKNFSKTYQVISEVLSGKFELVEGRPDFMTTGDVVIVIGNDIKAMYVF